MYSYLVHSAVRLRLFPALCVLGLPPLDPLCEGAFLLPERLQLQLELATAPLKPPDLGIAGVQ